MKQQKVFAAVAFGLVVSGCASVETPSRNVAFDGGAKAFVAGAGSELPAIAVSPSVVDIVDINVSVPPSLKVSEENGYYPSGDIVWRGEPVGDRHLQVKTIFEEGLAQGVSGIGGVVPATLNIKVERFHGVTEKTRYTFGGVHSIRFAMELRHAETGQLLSDPKTVKANLKAFGGQRAVDADLQGQTQRVRIVAHLSDVIQEELGRPAQKPTLVTELKESDQATF